jgi:hypothetical protein
MADPLRAHEPEPSPPHADSGHGAAPDDLTLGELVQRAREHAEAEAAVADVMRRENEKTAKLEAIEHRKHHTPPVKAALLAALLLFNLYLWCGNPAWLVDRRPSGLSVDYYESSWKIAVYLQRQRIEEYRREKGHVPATAQQAGQPVRGVQYTPIRDTDYELAAGRGPQQIFYSSTDSLSVLMGQTLLRMGLIAGGVR